MHRVVTVRCGFTLVELLVVVAIIGVLMALLLPAVQVARESARRTACRNQLRQVSLAAIQHTDTIGHFPSGGWGGSWAGDPDLGYGRSQPGGWIYALLEHLEEGSLRALGSGENDAEKKVSLGKALTAVLPIVVCPSRRGARLHEMPLPYTPANFDPPVAVGRSDYAANAGTVGVHHLGLFFQAGPDSLSDAESYPWPPGNIANGVVYARSEIAPRQVTDGMSSTYMLGERYLAQRMYEGGAVNGDRGFALMGYAADTVRMARASHPPMQDGRAFSHVAFGSAHPSALGMAFCDGSVREIGYDIDPLLHASHGNRRDGTPPAN